MRHIESTTVNLIRLLAWGFLISFLGSLPLGTMNVTSAQISIDKGTGPAIWFAFGSMMVELIYVRLLIELVQAMFKKKHVLLFFEWVSSLLILILAIASF